MIDIYTNSLYIYILLIILRGRLFLIYWLTRCPFIPWPSNTPNACTQSRN